MLFINLSVTKIISQWFIEVADDYYVIKTTKGREGYLVYEEEKVRNRVYYRV